MAVIIKRVAPMTREQVAEAMGLSVQRIQQIETEALEKCKRRLEEQGYTLDDLVIA